MPVRRATRRWGDLGAFLKDWNGTMQAGALFLPADAVDGELMGEFKLDLDLPILGRVGPIRAQVVQRLPDGSAGLQLPDLRAEAGPRIDELLAVVESLKQHLLSTGEVVERSAIAELEQRVQRAEEAAAAAQAAAAAAPALAAAVGADGEIPVVAAAPAKPKGRGFPVPALDGLAPLLEGDLSGSQLLDMTLELAAKRITGVLTLKLADGRTRYGFWNKGGPVAFRTDPLSEAEVLGVLLFKAGQITKEQLQESLDRMKSTGQRQGEALIDMGLMTFSQLIMVLGKQAEFVFSRLMAETAGTWTFHELEALPEQFLPPPVRVPALLFRSLVQRARGMPAVELAATYRERIDRYIHFRPELVPLLAEVKFDAAERKLLEVMQSNTWRMREVFSVSPISRQATAAVVWALVEMGFLDFERTEDRERYLRRVTEFLQRKKRQLAKCTHFDVLEVHWISLPDEIRLAYERLRQEYDPNAYEELPEELVSGMNYVRQRLEESYNVLGSDMQRREYRKELIEPVMIVQSAELLAKKGEMAIMRKDRREATTCFAKALELVPGNPPFRDGLQRARTAI